MKTIHVYIGERRWNGDVVDGPLYKTFDVESLDSVLPILQSAYPLFEWKKSDDMPGAWTTDTGKPGFFLITQLHSDTNETGSEE